MVKHKMKIVMKMEEETEMEDKMNISYRNKR